MIKEFRSYSYAAEVAWICAHMTGDICTVVPGGKPGKWFVLRNVGDEWVEV